MKTDSLCIAFLDALKNNTITQSLYKEVFDRVFKPACPIMSYDDMEDHYQRMIHYLINRLPRKPVMKPQAFIRNLARAYRFGIQILYSVADDSRIICRQVKKKEKLVNDYEITTAKVRAKQVRKEPNLKEVTNDIDVALTRMMGTLNKNSRLANFVKIIHEILPQAIEQASSLPLMELLDRAKLCRALYPSITEPLVAKSLRRELDSLKVFCSTQDDSLISGITCVEQFYGLIFGLSSRYKMLIEDSGLTLCWRSGPNKIEADALGYVLHSFIEVQHRLAA